MRLFLLVASVTIATASAAAPVAAPWGPKALADSDCPRSATHPTFEHGESIKPQKLTELPSANQYLAVYRRINGCEVPLVVRYNVVGQR